MAKRIRLVAVIGQLEPGGSERQLTLMLRQLDPQQFESCVLVIGAEMDSPYVDQLLQHGIDVSYIPENCHGIGCRLQYTARQLKAFHADIVHSWSVHTNPYAGFAGLLAGTPVRWGSLRGSLNLPGFLELPLILRLLSLWSVRRICVNSHALAQELRAHRYPEDWITILPNCVARIEKSQKVDLARFGIDSECRIIGMVGNLREVKNQLLFVEALAEVSAEFPDVRGLIVGRITDGELEYGRQIKRQIHALNLQKRVFLTGFCPNAQALMRHFTLLCLPSRSEGMPNVILEAMAAGVPVVASAVGGVPELITHGQNGLLFPSDDLDSLVIQIRNVLADNCLAKRLGMAGQRTVESKFDCQFVANQFAALYQTALRD